VFNPIFLCQLFHQLGSELISLVGNNFMRDNEAVKDVFIDFWPLVMEGSEE
jgi:hypothetical protein